MHQRRTFTILALATCLVHSLEINNEAKTNHRDMFDTAEALLRDLNETVNNELKLSFEILPLIRDEAIALANSVLATSRVSIEGIAIKLSREVEKIESAANEAGVDVDVVRSCSETCLNQLNYLCNTVQSEVDHCVNTTLLESVRLVGSTIEDLDNNRNVVTYFQLQIDQCRLLPDETQCILDVIQKISIERVDMPAKIREDTARTEAVVEALESSYGDCSANRVQNIDIIANVMINELKACVNLPEIL